LVITFLLLPQFVDQHNPDTVIKRRITNSAELPLKMLKRASALVRPSSIPMQRSDKSRCRKHCLVICLTICHADKQQACINWSFANMPAAGQGAASTGEVLGELGGTAQQP